MFPQNLLIKLFYKIIDLQNNYINETHFSLPTETQTRKSLKLKNLEIIEKIHP